MPLAISMRVVISSSLIFSWRSNWSFWMPRVCLKVALRLPITWSLGFRLFVFLPVHEQHLTWLSWQVLFSSASIIWICNARYLIFFSVTPNARQSLPTPSLATCTEVVFTSCITQHFRQFVLHSLLFTCIIFPCYDPGIDWVVWLMGLMVVLLFTLWPDFWGMLVSDMAPIRYSTGMAYRRLFWDVDLTIRLQYSTDTAPILHQYVKG